MKRLQAFIVFLLFFTVLMASVFLPPAVSQLKDRSLFGKINTQFIDEKTVVSASSMNVEDKLILISSYNRDAENVIMVNQQQNLGLQSGEQDVALSAVKELENMREKGLFPDIPLDNGSKFLDYTLMTYTDISKPGNSCRIWSLSFSFGSSGKNVCNVLMDAETHMIYQFYVWTDESLPVYDLKAVASKFVQYIGIQWDEKSPYTQSEMNLYSAGNGEILYQFFQAKDNQGFGIQMITNKKIIDKM
ncbi:hypothetical protein KCX82_21175 [Clostridiales bacterium BAD-6]|uniref:Uncharacterized protein n=2 Tax=Sinanaerobacter chloroacetimidivorans TaxID=2818044 RepID=A0A8J8B3I9_9FIRM|nr:hypothetical protein [Sinanaerobacter chloroacetimidivorans]